MERSRFTNLWNQNRLPGAPDRGGAIFDEIHAAYGEAHRCYHDREHIDFCLRQFDRIRVQLDDPATVELAIWFHDLIYLPARADNERRSADRFIELARGSLAPALIARVEVVIMATTHLAPPQDADAAYLTDIDLSGFGLPWDLFRRDNDRVRCEFAAVDDERYVPAQLAFQQRLLDREHFFTSPFFRQRYERQARANLARYHREQRALGFQTVRAQA